MLSAVSRAATTAHWSDSANYFAPPTEGIEFLLRAALKAVEFIHSPLMSFLFPVMKSVWSPDVQKEKKKKTYSLITRSSESYLSSLSLNWGIKEEAETSFIACRGSLHPDGQEGPRCHSGFMVQSRRCLSMSCKHVDPAEELKICSWTLKV